MIEVDIIKDDRHSMHTVRGSDRHGYSMPTRDAGAALHASLDRATALFPMTGRQTDREGGRSELTSISARNSR